MHRNRWTLAMVLVARSCRSCRGRVNNGEEVNSHENIRWIFHTHGMNFSLPNQHHTSTTRTAFSIYYFLHKKHELVEKESEPLLVARMKQRSGMGAFSRREMKRRRSAVRGECHGCVRVVEIRSSVESHDAIGKIEWAPAHKGELLKSTKRNCRLTQNKLR
jgi:hypothetical protein